ncbi:restriction endonuclease subunit S [uncultured Abiotrophia sp.]|uniref:restriction endonuclease subunit S n=1 Tax=uncultured Abiotrophia sp. TaxID=316094 RepID=UPI0028D1108F|nr:restriction endonuclease subunit S [uncultured Abiotrophia sp.]
MSDKKRKVPKLRFPGFTDAWEQQKLGEVVNKCYGGGTPRTSVEEYWTGNIPWLQSSNLIDDDVQNAKVEKFISENAIDSSAAKMIPSRSIAVVTRVGIGKLVLMDKDFATSQDFLSLSGILLEEQFMLYALYILLKSEKRKGQGTSIKGITKEVLLNKDIRFPGNSIEQLKTGNFFKLFDALISLHQRKLDNVKMLKKSLLQKLFPKDGEKIPELRFPGFTDDWEQRKLGEVVDVTMGQSPNSSNYTDNPEDYILVQGNADMKDGRVFPRVWTTQVTKKAHKGDLILSVRAPVGDVGKTDYDVVIGRGVASIKGNEFIFQLLGKMKLEGYWDKLSTGSTFDSINSSDIKSSEIYSPNADEQTLMGEFFVKIDSLISLHQRKLDHLKELKKGLLQQMFV